MIKKKLLVCAALILTAGGLLMGCSSDAAETAMEETRLAVSNGKYDEALTYAKLAVKEGATDESFMELVNLLEEYSEVEEALDNNDPDKALELIDSMSNPEANGMAAAVEAAKDKANTLLDAADTSISSVNSPKAMASEEEAVEIAREFLNIPANAKYTYKISLVSGYYNVNFEVDYDGEIDEVACKVDAKGFYAYDPVG